MDHRKNGKRIHEPAVFRINPIFFIEDFQTYVPVPVLVGFFCSCDISGVTRLKWFSL